MQQQINLFQPVFRRETKVFSARALAQALGLAMVLIVASLALLQVQLGRHTAARDLLDGQFRQLDEHLKALESRADPAEMAALDTRIKNLESRLAEGRVELDGLKAELRDGELSFARVLETLARHPRDGLWLTAIRVHDDTLELEGTTLDSERLLAYLADVNDDPELSAWPLTTVQLDREDAAADGTGRLRFVLRSSGRLEDAL